MSGCSDGRRTGEHWHPHGSPNRDKATWVPDQASPGNAEMGSTTCQCHRQGCTEVPIPKDPAPGSQEHACLPQARRGLSPSWDTSPSQPLLLPQGCPGQFSPSTWVRILAVTPKEAAKECAAQLGPGIAHAGVRASGMDGMRSVMSTVPRDGARPWPGAAGGGGDSAGLTSYTWKKRVEVSIRGEKQNKARLNHTSSPAPRQPEPVRAQGRHVGKTKGAGMQNQGWRTPEGLEKSWPTHQDTDPWWQHVPQQRCPQGTEGTNTTTPR